MSSNQVSPFRSASVETTMFEIEANQLHCPKAPHAYALFGFTKNVACKFSWSTK